MQTTGVLATVAALVMIISAGPARAETQPPAPADLQKAREEVDAHYAAAAPEVKEYVLWTATSFGRNGLWMNEDAFASLSPEEREKKIQYLVALFADSDYGRHLCRALGEAGSLKDPRLVPGLMKVAGYEREGGDYDCRAKWMAVAALSRQESEDAVPLLISLVDFGNKNVRTWSRAALSRKTGQDFKEDKLAWAKWWTEQGHAPVDAKFLKSFQPPRTSTE